jgi:endonuclease/exonuclease/phosphatase family metal-dependent hydrolase
MDPASDGTLRVMTLNIWNYNEPWTRRRDLIAEAVQQVQPHVIGFQEIRHDGKRDDGGKNQAEQLAEGLPGYRYLVQPAQRNPEHDQWEGLAIFSRLPILSSSHLELSRDPQDSQDNHQRIVLQAGIQTSGGPFSFCATHLSLSDRGRRRTVREVARFVKRPSSGLPGVVVGDFNATPAEESVTYLTTEGELIDAWSAANGSAPGITFDGANPYTGSDESGRRIDYIFLSQAGAGRLTACWRVADQPAADGHMPSDHFGLAADILLEERPEGQ